MLSAAACFLNVRRLPPAVAALAVTAALVSGQAQAEVAIVPYVGADSTMDADVRLKRPGDTDLTFRDVSWDSASFTGPIYCGLQVSWWPEGWGHWGLMFDYTHAKMFADLERAVAVSGSRDGTPISGTERLGDTFDDLSFSHGHNLLTLNAAHRWRADRRVRPFVGGGLGASLAHVEVGLGEDVTDEYQLAGPAAQVLGGAEVRFGRLISVVVEYKLSWADIDTDLQGGGSLHVRPWTHQFVFGVGFNL
jgi:hypothetical protein